MFAFLFFFPFSGKSTILHAIQLVFGAKAADTTRGKNVIGLVNRQQTYAEISVWIKNSEGPNAFQYNLYGPEIQLTRRIRVTSATSASSTYVMSGTNAKGEKYQTTQSKDVVEMCEYFNIQVSNPCVIMTQEVSRKFLQSKKAEDKYQFFLKATQFEIYRSSLAEVQNRIDLTRTVLTVQQAKIPDLDQRIDELLKLEKLAEEADAIEKEIIKLGNQIAWRKVKNYEILYDETEQQYESMKSKIALVESKLQKLQESHQSREAFEAEVNQHVQTLTQSQAELNTVRGEIRQRKQTVEQVKTEQRQHHHRIAKEKAHVKELESSLTQITKKIESIHERNSRDTSIANDKFDTDRAKLIEERQLLETEARTNVDEINRIEQERVQLGLEESELHSQTGEAQRRYNRTKGEYDALMREAGGPASSAAAAAGRKAHNVAFGAHTSAIWAEIRKQRWKCEPIGPLGEYVQIKTSDADEDFLPGITECLTHKHMSTYVVDNFEDQTKLMNIFKHVVKEGFKPMTVVLRKNARYEVQRPHVPFPLVMDCIKIDDDWAYNSVVFLAKIERYGLHRDANEAVEQLRPYRASQLPRDSNDFISGIFLNTGTKIRIMGNSARGTILSAKANERPMFKINREEQLKSLQKRSSDDSIIFDDLRRRCQAKAQEVKAVAHKMDPLKLRNRDIKRRLERIEDELSDLELRAERARRDVEKIDDTPFVIQRDQTINEIEEKKSRQNNNSEKCNSQSRRIIVFMCSHSVTSFGFCFALLCCLLGHIADLESKDATRFEDQIRTLNDAIGELTAKAETIQSTITAEEKWIADSHKRWQEQEVATKKYTDHIKKLNLDFATIESKFGQVSSDLHAFTRDAEMIAPERDDSDLSSEQLEARRQAKKNTLAEKVG